MVLLLDPLLQLPPLTAWPSTTVLPQSIPSLLLLHLLLLLLPDVNADVDAVKMVQRLERRAAWTTRREQEGHALICVDGVVEWNVKQQNDYARDEGNTFVHATEFEQLFWWRRHVQWLSIRDRSGRGRGENVCARRRSSIRGVL